MTDVPPTPPPGPGAPGPYPNQGWPTEPQPPQPPPGPGWAPQGPQGPPVGGPPPMGGYGGPPPAGGGSGKPNVALWAVLGVLLVVAIGGGIFLLAGGDDDDDNNDQTEQSNGDQGNEDDGLDLPEIDEDTDTTDSDTPTTDGSSSSGGGLANADIDVSEIEGMSDASDVILSFIQHEIDKNCESMWTLVSTSWPDETDFVTECESTYGEFGEIEVQDVSVTSVTDSAIVVESNQTIDGSPHLSTYTMILEEGTSWIDEWN